MNKSKQNDSFSQIFIIISFTYKKIGFVAIRFIYDLKVTILNKLKFWKTFEIIYLLNEINDVL
jgi:hypothetical protein